MRIFIISGEASGDHLGSILADALYLKDPSIELAGWGGPSMRQSGVQIYHDIGDHGIMGYWEVLRHVVSIKGGLEKCRTHIAAFDPDKVVLIDYGGFNTQMAKWCKNEGFPVVYFNPPKYWASRPWRLKNIQKLIDRFIVTLPFEKSYYENCGIQHVSYFGHPLLEKIPEKTTGKPGKDEKGKPIVALLPGSRKPEIIRILPTMALIAGKLKNYRFIASCAPGIDYNWFNSILTGHDDQLDITTDTYGLLSQASYAVIASGTASLEAALFQVPHVVVYRLNWLNYLLARLLIKVKYISLVNLILDKKVVTELIQREMTTSNLLASLESLQDPKIEKQMLADFMLMRQLLGKKNIMQNISDAIIKL